MASATGGCVRGVVGLVVAPDHEPDHGKSACGWPADHLKQHFPPELPDPGHTTD
ncbi:hypothetical protein G9272_44145 [Streptomyces asoensis]|uniref:Uncharacterized protein n=1 Tax=Streptomyces asoensis TaxID=249586 RepID=A0A6M4X7Y0_9ACTN|nr:hypothetical protein [Streptomyces asoensis]QJT06426.1 hypothetical protein G9272_44145 [Streptomyces asoensis]